jgi:hypothetical protein
LKIFNATITNVLVAKARRGVKERFLVEKKDFIQLRSKWKSLIVIGFDL